MAPLLSDSINTLMTYLEWLQKNKGIWAHHTFIDLPSELKLLQGICYCAEIFLLRDLVSLSEENEVDDQTLESFYNQLGVAINEKIQEIDPVYQEIRNGLELENTRCDALFFSFVDAVETLKPLVRKVVDKYLHSSQFKQCTKEELVDFIQLLIDNGNGIHGGSCVKSLQLHKLYFLKYLIIFVALRAGVGHDKFQDLLARTQVVVITAAIYSYMLWRPQVVDEETFLLIHSQYSEMLQFLLDIILKDSTRKLSVLIATLRAYLAWLKTFLRNTGCWSRFDSNIGAELRLAQMVCSSLEMFFLQDQSLKPFLDCIGSINEKAWKINSVIHEITGDYVLEKLYNRLMALNSSRKQIFDEVLAILQSFLFRKALDKYVHSSQSKHCTTEELLDFIQLVSEEGKEIYGVYDLESLQLNKLEFLKNFISFATSRHVGQDKLQDLLAHAKVVVTTATYCLYLQRSDGESWSTICSQYSEMLKVPLNVRESFIRVLKELGSSSSSDYPKMDDNIVEAFINSLLGNHWELLGSKSSFTVSFMKIFIEELRFFINFLIYRKQEGGDLGEEMTNLIFDAVSEAAIVSYSISWDDPKEVPTKDTKLGLSNWMEKVQLLKEDVAKKYPESSRYKFPRINKLDFMDSQLEDLKELIRYNPDSTAFARGQLDVVLKDLVFLRDFFQDMVKQSNEHEELKDLWFRALDVAYRFKFVINSLVVGDPSPDCNPTSFNTIKEEIKKIRVEVQEISVENWSQSGASSTPRNSNCLLSRTTNPTVDEVIVGFEDAAEEIINQLEANSTELDIVSIVGMPGQGKTTLAKKIYNDIRIKSHFHVCAWCCVSHGYQKRKLLLDILSDSPDDINYSKKSVEDLENVLRQSLKGRRYLIILDDIWDIESWRGLKPSFPDDCNGSRILITSRIHIEELQATPHFLRPLNYDESRKLLQTRLLHNKGCTEKIQNLVAKICKGIPLAVVTVAGILETFEQDSWEEYVKGLSTTLVSGTEECTELLQLSYIHLPEYLKPCFLYFGSFLQDEEIPVSRLIWLWMAEGFVQKTTDEKRLENVAEDYLKDLINRSLVMVVKRKSRGGIKACSVHDLVHQFCVTRAKEENFFHLLNPWKKTTPLFEPHRLCVSSWSGVQCFRHLSSLKFIDPTTSQKFFDRSFPKFVDRSFLKFFNHDYNINVSSILCSFKVLKVLDLRGINCDRYPAELEVLVILRFLALAVAFRYIPWRIVKLRNLETFILKGSLEEISLPYTLLNMTKLRHIYVNSGVLFHLPEHDLEKCCESSTLETFCVLRIHHQQDVVQIIRKMPYLRKLKCVCYDAFPALDFLSQLESLNVHSGSMHLLSRSVVQYHLEFSFPVNLKKLTLSNFGLPWSSISRFAQLPKLEVLKLLDKACEGVTWDMEEEDVFKKLQFLKFKNLDIVRWNVYSDNFPCLRHLVLHECWWLQGIPLGVGEVDSLEIVEVKCCNSSVKTSAENMKEEKEGLKAFIHVW